MLPPLGSGLAPDRLPSHLISIVIHDISHRCQKLLIVKKEEEE